MFGTLISGVKTLDKVFGLIKDGEEGKLADLADSDGNRGVLYSNGSMIKLLNKFIIEPKIVVSSSLKSEKEIENAISLNLDLFTSLYSQVFNVLVNIHGLDHNTAFELLSSSSTGSYGMGRALESMDTLISMEDMDIPTLPISDNAVISLEAKGNKRKTHSKDNSEVGGSKREIKSTVKEGKSAISKLITREIEISIDVKGKGRETGKKVEYKVVIPVLVKASIIYSDFSNIERMMSVSSKDKQFLNRVDEYRAGAIGLNDLIFASDLVREYKSKRIKDVDDLIKDMESRSRTSKLKVVSGGAVGYNKYYQMLFITAGEKARVERLIAGKLSKDRFKNAFLEQTNSLALTVMDSDWERASIYIMDLKGYSDISYKSLSKSSKSEDRMEDMLKLMMAGKTI